MQFMIVYMLLSIVHERLMPLVSNEAQLIYMLRLVVPFLQRFNDQRDRFNDQRDRTKQVMDVSYICRTLFLFNDNVVCLQLVVDIYHMLARVNDAIGEFQYSDSLCDLLYHLKYMFVGDVVKNEADRLIDSFN